MHEVEEKCSLTGEQEPSRVTQGSDTFEEFSPWRVEEVSDSHACEHEPKPREERVVIE